MVIFLQMASNVHAVAPTVTLSAPSSVTSTSITLNGSINPNGAASTGYFRYWSNDPGFCVDAGGYKVPVSGGAAYSDSISHAFAYGITGLIPGKTYYYCVIGMNNSTYERGYHSTTPSTFTTTNAGETSCDTPPNTAGGVTINSTCGFPTQPVGANLPLGTVSGMDGGSLTISSGQALSIGVGQTVVFQTITKTGASITKGTGGVLRKGYIWVKDGDGDGFYAPNSATYSSSSTTPPIVGYVRRNTISGGSYLTQAVDCDDTNASKNLPSHCLPGSTSTNSVTNITATTATLNGVANPNGDAGTRAYFHYELADTTPDATGYSNGGDCESLSASTSGTLITGTSSQPFTANLTGLTTGVPYYWCAIVFNNTGMKYSTVGTFVPMDPPTSITLNGITQTNVTVNWTAPSGAAGFKIYRCTGSSCTPTSFLANDANNATPHADTTVSCGTTYGYQVSGTTATGGGGYEGPKSSSIVYATTSSCVSAPTLSSPTATSITGTSATLGGTVTSNGGASLNARGTCWSTSDTDPRIGDAGVSCLAEGGTSVAAFSHSRTGLSPSSTVWYTAYATNTSGFTGYTTATSFSTPALLANGSTCTSGSQCSSGNCYVDNDGDLRAPASGTKTCRASAQVGTDGYDCDDTTGTANLVYQGQTSYRTTAISSTGAKNGTFDYDCSGTITASPSPAQYCSSRATSDDFYSTYQTCGSFMVSGYFCTSGPFALSLPSACGKYQASGPYYALSGGCVTSTVVASTTIGCR